MQEVCFSSRIVCFTTSAADWNCHIRGSRWEYGEETLDLRRRGVWFTAQSVRFNSRFDWFKIVEGYSSSNFTVATDILPAISTLAQETNKRRLNDSYLAGVWASSLPRGLSWSSALYSSHQGAYNGKSLLELPVAKLAKRKEYPDYLSPTWSWVSAGGPVVFSPFAKVDDGEYGKSVPSYARVQLIKADIHPRPGANIFGRLSEETYLLVKAPIRGATLKDSDRGDLSLSIIDDATGTELWTTSFQPDHLLVVGNGKVRQIYHTDNTFKLLPPGKFTCALICHKNLDGKSTMTSVLILYQALGCNACRRLGQTFIADIDLKFVFPESCMEEITLI
jgi:hypothetical protein